MDTFASSSEEALRTLARAIAPYVAEELRRLEQLEQEELDPDYGDPTCERFVSDLGSLVLERALIFFDELDRDGVLDSLQVADLLGVAPRELSGNLTTPLKRRAKALRLSLPFAGGRGDQLYGGIENPAGDMDPQRTYWRDRDGIAARMKRALRRELTRRATNPESRRHR